MKPLGWLCRIAALMCAVACSEAPSDLIPTDVYVANVVSADITGDGTSDLIVNSGTGSTRRPMYFLDGATDVDLAASDVLESWTLRKESSGTSRGVVVPTAREPLLIVVGTEPVPENEDRPPLTLVMARRLRDLEPVWWTLISYGSWLDVVSHGGREWLYVGAGSSLWRVPIDELPSEGSSSSSHDNPPMEVVSPPPGLAESDESVMAIGVGEGGIGIVTRLGIHTNPDAGVFAEDAWSIVRHGELWEPQTHIDLDGDGYDEVIGFDKVASQLCAFDLRRGVSGCLPVASSSEAYGTTISGAGPRGGRDVLLVRPIIPVGGVAMNRADLFKSLAFHGASLQEGEHAVASFESSGSFHVFEFHRDPSSTSVFMLLTTGGEARCISRVTAHVTTCAE